MKSDELKKTLENKFGVELKLEIDKIEKYTTINPQNLKKNNFSSIEEQNFKNNVQKIPINKIIKNPYQFRKIFNKEQLDNLAKSIKSYGLFTPILLKQTLNNYYIIAGERRFRACKLLNFKKINAIIVEINEQQLAEICLVENIQRENLTAIEEAEGINVIIENYKYTHLEIANKLGKSRSHITNLLRILTLPQKVKEFILEGKLKMGHVKQLHSFNNDNDKIAFAKKIIENKFSSHEVEQKIFNLKTQKYLNKNRKNKLNNLNLIDLENELINLFQTKVRITNNKIIINYSNINQLNSLIKKIKMYD